MPQNCKFCSRVFDSWEKIKHNTHEWTHKAKLLEYMIELKKGHTNEIREAKYLCRSCPKTHPNDHSRFFIKEEEAIEHAKKIHENEEQTKPPAVKEKGILSGDYDLISSASEEETETEATDLINQSQFDYYTQKHDNPVVSPSKQITSVPTEFNHEEMDVDEAIREAIGDSNRVENSFFHKATEAPSFSEVNLDSSETLIDPGMANKFRKDVIPDDPDNNPFKQVTSKKSRKRKHKDNSDKKDENKKPKTKVTFNFSNIRDTEAASFIEENDQLMKERENVDNVTKEDEKNDKLKNDKPNVSSNNTKVPDDSEVIEVKEKVISYDLFITNIDEKYKSFDEMSSTLSNIINKTLLEFGIQHKVPYQIYKTKKSSVVRLSTKSVPDHILLQKVFLCNKNPMGPNSKCEFPHYYKNSSKPNDKREDPIWTVVKNVPRDYTKFELKEDMTNDSTHPITCVRLKNASGHTLSTVKALFPAAEAKRILNEKEIKVGDIFCPVEECLKVPSPTILQCYNCQKIGHTAHICKSSTRCPRCAGKHKASECHIPVQEFSNYKCALCEKYGHGSSFSLCPKRQELVRDSRDRLIGPTIKNPPIINNENFPPLDTSSAPPQLTHPLLVPQVRAVLEGLVGGLIQIFEAPEKATRASVMQVLSSSLERHANIKIDLNQDKNQVSLVATKPKIPSAISIPITTPSTSETAPTTAKSRTIPSVSPWLSETPQNKLPVRNAFSTSKVNNNNKNNSF